MEKYDSFAMIAMVAIVAVVGLVVLIVGGKSSTQIQPVPVSVSGDLSGQYAYEQPFYVLGKDDCCTKSCRGKLGEPVKCTTKKACEGVDGEWKCT